MTQETQANWKGFIKLVLIQGQNVLNEKGAQFLLIPLGVWLYGQEGDLEYPLGAIAVLPFVLFSPLVGWMGDRLCKTRIIQAMAVIQVLVLLGMYLCLRFHMLYGAVTLFCVFAVQTTIFSPAKKGIVKDLVGSKYIGIASGITEMTSILGILLGQIGVFVWFSYLLETNSSSVWHQIFGDGFFQWFDAMFKFNGTNDGWYAASFPCFILMLSAIPVAIMSFTLPKYPAQSHRPFQWKLFYEHFGQLKKLWGNKKLRTGEMGIGYFWFFGGTILLMVIQMAKEVSGAGSGFGLVGAELMAWMSGGTVLGGVLASVLCKRHIRINLSWLGGWMMAVSCIVMACLQINTLPFYMALGLAGVSAAFFLVPLNAFFLDRADSDQRGDMIAAGNLVDCFLGLLAVYFQYQMMVLIPMSAQFIVMAIICIIVTVFVRRSYLRCL